MAFEDHFSHQSPGYGRYRPTYPDGLFNYLAHLAPRHERAWDCATGTGQAAVGLSGHFDTVLASDASQTQIGQAPIGSGVRYLVGTAEEPPFRGATMDLVVVAQALHWFDVDAFYIAVRRVLRPGGVVAVFAYGLHRITPSVDRVVDHLYREVVGRYWPPQRRHIESGYSTLPFPFRQTTAPPFEMKADWTCDRLVGYLRTWSASERYRQERGEDPVALIERDLNEAWGSKAAREVSWPLTLRCGRRE